MILMTRAINERGTIVSIENVQRGQACKCTCIDCGAPLVARKGDENAHHFAHDADSKCNWSGETELHILAKEVLATDKKIHFTHLTFDGDPLDIEVPFAFVELEVRNGEFRPDVIGTTEEGDSISIEICVNHACEESKILYYKSNFHNALEVILPPSLLSNRKTIDIDYVRRCINDADIRCISLNPLSLFASHLVDINQTLIADQGDELRSIRKEIYIAKKELFNIRKKASVLKEEAKPWEEVVNITRRDAAKYKRELYKEIESQAELVEYRKEVNLFKRLSKELKKNYEIEVNKANRDIEIYENELRKKSHDNIMVREMNRLRNCVESLEAQKATLSHEVERLERLKQAIYDDKTVLAIDEYIQILNAKYENRLYELEMSWKEIKKRYPSIDKPDFFAQEAENIKSQPAISFYEKIRG